jgi:succinate dehydrogenase subunit C
MSEPAPSRYTPHHPGWYRSRVSTYWWLTRGAYALFILRELSSIFVAWFVGYLLLMIRAVTRGDPSYQRFLEWSGTPTVLVLNAVSLIFVLLHAVTWFNLAPQAMVVHVRRRKVPGWLIAASNYGAWVVVSGWLAWLILG